MIQKETYSKERKRCLRVVIPNRQNSVTCVTECEFRKVVYNGFSGISNICGKKSSWYNRKNILNQTSCQNKSFLSSSTKAATSHCCIHTIYLLCTIRMSGQGEIIAQQKGFCTTQRKSYNLLNQSFGSTSPIQLRNSIDQNKQTNKHQRISPFEHVCQAKRSCINIF